MPSGVQPAANREGGVNPSPAGASKTIGHVQDRTRDFCLGHGDINPLQSDPEGDALHRPKVEAHARLIGSVPVAPAGGKVELLGEQVGLGEGERLPGVEREARKKFQRKTGPTASPLSFCRTATAAGIVVCVDPTGSG